ncbi:uncharacterized protein [Macrobrachium rosenbergii]|uniref:uncharacterized protein n=1 Tax=Macrobrachium rosenbergii TaxID=79674 RepID=UPI0034D770E7
MVAVVVVVCQTVKTNLSFWLISAEGASSPGSSFEVSKSVASSAAMSSMLGGALCRLRNLLPWHAWAFAEGENMVEDYLGIQDYYLRTVKPISNYSKGTLTELSYPRS